MHRSSAQLREDALAIWQAGVYAVRADRLVRECVRVDGGTLTVGKKSFALDEIDQILVVGAGKAGAGMAEGLEQALGTQVLRDKRVSGWINVPANCVRRLHCIHLHAARPGGVNEPTESGVQGSREIMARVKRLTPHSLCIVLISGGGSALLPLPIDGITLDDKLAVTRFLSAEGAPIDELNRVRQQLSAIKAGGLARACRAGHLVGLVISDVLGDPLDLIASGPTVLGGGSPAAALAILERYGAGAAGVAPRALELLARLARERVARSTAVTCDVENFVIGSNAVAVVAAAAEASRRGYIVRHESAGKSEGPAEQVGESLIERALRMQSGALAEDCLISGGEPTVKLVSADQRGLGGRNQQLVLAAAAKLGEQWPPGVLLVSGGTDGEDGPTDAAGAWADAALVADARQRGLPPGEYLRRNDAYHWFKPLGGLIKTGPTDTNVCDLRVVLVEKKL